MIRFILCFCAVAYLDLSSTAQGYFKIFGTPLNEEHFIESMQEEHDPILEDLVCFIGVPRVPGGDSLSQSFVYRLDPSGEITDSLMISEESSKLMCSFSTPDGELVFFERSQSGTEFYRNINLTRTNSTLDILDVISYRFPDSLIYSSFTCGLVNTVGEYVLQGLAIKENSTSPESGNGLITFKLSPEFDSLDLFISPGPNSIFPSPLDIIQSEDGSYLMTTFLWFENVVPNSIINSDFWIAHLDTNLTPLSTYHIDLAIQDPPVGIQRYHDSLIICIGDIANPFPENTCDFTVAVLNEDFQLVDSVNLGSSYQGENLKDKVDTRCLSQATNGDIIVGSMYNFEYVFPPPYGENERWIQLYRLDSDLNVIWRKFYGGDKNYNLKEVRAMSNGDIMALGSVYDFVASPNEVDVDLFVLRTNEDGFITGLDESSFSIIEFKIFPNPTTDICTIQTNLSDYSIDIITPSGKHVHSISNNHKNISLNLNDFNSGIYLLRIQDNESSFVISEKLIVE